MWQMDYLLSLTTPSNVVLGDSLIWNEMPLKLRVPSCKVNSKAVGKSLLPMILPAKCLSEVLKLFCEGTGGM